MGFTDGRDIKYVEHQIDGIPLFEKKRGIPSHKTLEGPEDP
jgi:hypothetical protein